MVSTTKDISIGVKKVFVAHFISFLLSTHIIFLCKASILSRAVTLEHNEPMGRKLVGGTKAKFPFHTGGNVDTVLSLLSGISK